MFCVGEATWVYTALYYLFSVHVQSCKIPLCGYLSVSGRYIPVHPRLVLGFSTFTHRLFRGSISLQLLSIFSDMPGICRYKTPSRRLQTMKLTTLGVFVGFAYHERLYVFPFSTIVHQSRRGLCPTDAPGDPRGAAASNAAAFVCPLASLTASQMAS